MISTNQLVEPEHSVVDEAMAYWEKLLRNFSGSTSLGVQKNSTPATGLDAVQQRQITTLSKDITDSLRRFECELETLICGAWAILLSRFSGDRRVTFGSLAVDGYNNRSLPFVVNVDPYQPLAKWLERLEAQRLALLNYRESDWAQNEAAAWPEHWRFESSVAFDDAAINPSCPLIVLATFGEQTTLQLVYDPSRFADEMMQRLLDHLKILLTGMTVDREQQLWQLPLLTPAELEQQVEWNNTASP